MSLLPIILLGVVYHQISRSRKQVLHGPLEAYDAAASPKRKEDRDCAYFLQQWFSNKQWWFNSTPAMDAEITTSFVPLLVKFAKEPEVPHDVTYGELLARIISLDQLPYHVYRYTHPGSDVPFNSHLAKCMNIAHELLAKFSDQLTAEEWTFVMLPFRHTKQHVHIDWVLKHAWKRLLDADVTLHDATVYRRFIEATYKRSPGRDALVHLHPIVTSINFDHASFHDILLHTPHQKACMNLRCQVRSVLARMRPLRRFHNVVEYCQGCCDSNVVDSYGNVEFVRDALAFVTEPAIKHRVPWIISLSGGVDSMVLCHVLANYRTSHPDTALIAVHINYKNKPTCDRDEALAVAWCAHLGITCYVRRLEEIQRTPCKFNGLREIYESYTENQRYATYQQAHLEHVQSSQVHPLEAAGATPLAFLGHNACDVFENIIANLMKQQKYEDLRGMSIVSPTKAKDATLVRPMLNIPKHQIRAYALRNNVPHLEDSTPAWTQRGRIRDLKPTLNAFDTRLIPAFNALASRVSALSEVVNQQVKSIVASAVRLPSNVWWIEMDLQAFTSLTNQHWSDIIYHLTQIRTSQKSLLNLLERVNAMFVRPLHPSRQNTSPACNVKLSSSLLLHAQLASPERVSVEIGIGGQKHDAGTASTLTSASAMQIVL